MNFAVLWTAVLVVLLDQFSKFLAIKSLSAGPLEIIDGIFLSLDGCLKWDSFGLTWERQCITQHSALISMELIRFYP